MLQSIRNDFTTKILSDIKDKLIPDLANIVMEYYGTDEYVKDYSIIVDKVFGNRKEIRDFTDSGIENQRLLHMKNWDILARNTVPIITIRGCKIIFKSRVHRGKVYYNIIQTLELSDEIQNRRTQHSSRNSTAKIIPVLLIIFPNLQEIIIEYDFSTTKRFKIDFMQEKDKYRLLTTDYTYIS
jgi:hypothetical protein